MPEPVRWQDAWWYQQADGSWLRYNDATQQWEPIAVQGYPAYATSTGMTTGAKVAIGVAVGFVALLVLAILAAIAIPVFLSQREKAWVSQVESALAVIAQAQESHCVFDESPQCYATSIDQLRTEAFTIPEEVNVQVARADASSYCLEARHEMLPNDIWSYDSTIGSPREGPCM